MGVWMIVGVTMIFCVVRVVGSHVASFRIIFANYTT